MGICLNMIVKNESSNLERLFTSLHESIDYYVISDTGSTDNTIIKINELGRQFNIPGIVLENSWVDFAHNRNLALEAAVNARKEGKHSCNWILIIDADEELVELDNTWKTKLVDGYSYSTYKKIGGIVFKHYFLLWIEGQQLKWEGRIHNYLISINGKILKSHIADVFIQSHLFQGSKSHPFKDYREKALHDIRLLHEELDGNELQRGNVHRFFQLGYLYRAYGDFDAAIYHLEKVVAFEHSSRDVRYISLILMMKILINLKGDNDRIHEYFHKAIKIDEKRLEAYYYHAILYRRLGDLTSALHDLNKASAISISDQSYFYFEEDIYKWKVKYELAFVYFQLKNYVEAESIIRELIDGNLAPKDEKKFLFSLLERISNSS